MQIKIKIKIKIIIIILIFSLFSFNNKIDKTKAFKDGETLEYRLHYGIINAGVALLKVKKLDNRIHGREIYHIIGYGKTKGAFDWFFKVRDKYETFLDVDGIFPWVFIRNVSEGGYKIKQNYKFYQFENKVDNGSDIFDVPYKIQDMLSSLYYARSIDYSNAKIGEIFTISSFVDNEIWDLKIRYMGRDEIKVSGERYKALKFHPVVQEGRLFKNEEDVTVWISDDKNKIPLLAQGRVLIGSIKMELIGYSGLANKLSIIK